MPPKSEKQRKFMAMIASGKKPSKVKTGPSKEVAEEILHGSKGKKDKK